MDLDLPPLAPGTGDNRIPGHLSGQEEINQNSLPTHSSYFSAPTNAGRIGRGLDDPLRQLANSNASMNSYNRAQADQTRAAQFALMNQMRGTPSQSAMASRRVLSQGASAALNGGGRGALGSANMLSGFSGASGGALGALAQQAAQESMGKQQMLGASALGLRGRDIQSGAADADAKLREQQLNDDTRLRASKLGSGLQKSRQDALVESYKQEIGKRQKREADELAAAKASAEGFGTVLQLLGLFT